MNIGENLLSKLSLIILLGQIAGVASPIQAQNTEGQQTLRQQSAAQSAPPESWLVRDPRTGRLYRQQWQTVSTPTTQWRPKAVKQTVYEPQVVTTTFQTNQTVFVPQTRQVLHQRVVGRWNPFRPTAVQYQYRPVTSWVPQNQTLRIPVATQRWTSREETSYRWEASTKMVPQKQLVSTEIPQPGTNLMAASSAPALINIPILRNQHPAPLRRTANAITRAWQPAYPVPVNPTPPPNPIAQAGAASYSAPLRTASSSNGSFSRDSMQAGMSATVLR